MYRLIIPVLALIAGSAALSAGHDAGSRLNAKEQAALDKALAGFTAGKPVECINQTRVRDTQRFGDKLLYQFSPREKYLTDTGGGCSGLRQGDAIITRSSIAQFCRGDIVRTADLMTHTPSGSCSFGSFTPYTR
jgi:hypothetical protein